jgi:hypothetical protein
MMRAWHNAVDKAVRAAGGDSDISYAVLNKNIKELREQFDVDVIEAGFHRFAEQVRNGKIDVRARAAWFSFWSRRKQLVYTVASVDRLPDEATEAANPFDIAVEAPSNPFES